MARRSGLIGNRMANTDDATLAAFDANHSYYLRSASTTNPDAERAFEAFFSLLPPRALQEKEGFDLGAGTGRLAAHAARQVRLLHCIEPSSAGVKAMRAELPKNVAVHQADSDHIPLPDGSQDFGYSFGVLHHIPNTLDALKNCTSKLKPGAPFLVYLYYRFDNRPFWFRLVWRLADILRRGICRLPFGLRKVVTDSLALSVYWPLSRAARIGERGGARVDNWPLNAYRNSPFRSLRADSLDRFGTALEQRFTRAEIVRLMETAGLRDIRFAEGPPYWMAVGTKVPGAVDSHESDLPKARLNVT